MGEEEEATKHLTNENHNQYGHKNTKKKLWKRRHK